jgi:hypothetical protein
MKDAKGHGSDTGTRGMRLIKTHVNGPHSAKVYNNPEWGEKVVKFFDNGVYQSKADSHTADIADAHGTAQNQLKRYADRDAAASLHSGTSKSAPAPTHDAMAVSDRVNRAIQNSPTGSISGREAHNVSRPGYNEHGSRHGYNPDSVNSAIAAQNRSGRGKIGGREASAIHRLLKGR